MPSTRGLEPGDNAADFILPNANFNIEIHEMSKEISLEQTIQENGAVILFTCNHCPYVVASEERIESIASICRDNGMGFVGINSNDPIVYPSDDWDHMTLRAAEMSYPYLHDANQLVAHAYGAERTPEFFLVNGQKIIVYRGRLDDSPRDPSKATTHDLVDAIQSMLSGEKIVVARTDSIGCSVKWKV